MENYTFEDLKEGHSESFEHTINESDMENFTELSDDKNPLHNNTNFAISKGFQGKVVYGMMLAAYFSRLVGMYLPGVNCLYLSQTVMFHKPAYVGETIIIKGTVVKKVDSLKILVIKTEIFNKKNNILLTDGTANVKII